MKSARPPVTRDVDRRAFFRTVAMAPVAAASAAIGLQPSAAEAYDPSGDERRARYQPDGADVKAFYRTNGYETRIK